ncbi:MAG: hypothetical protein WD049_02405 [Candidatus Paceibacterota bacterium]
MAKRKTRGRAGLLLRSQSPPRANSLTEARRLLAAALLDVAETRLELGQSLPTPNASATDPEMDFEEPIYLHLSASSQVDQVPTGEVAKSR